jgi:uncharacterized membrane protein YfcA
MTTFEVLVAVAAFLAGGVASVAGFGFWQLRRHVDGRVFRGFGLASAAGGLAGALLHVGITSRALTVVLGLLLVFAGSTGLFGLTERLRFRGALVWVAGALSGVFGGLVGNQGGIRSAALLGFDLSRDAFVATATAIGLIIDAARLPVYVALQGSDLVGEGRLLLAATAGGVLGTLVGRRVLRRVPEPVFRRVVAAIILALGVGLLIEVALGR